MIEYCGSAIDALSMEGRMTVCNMSIEGGARAGMIAPDDKTFAYLKDRPKSPKGALWDQAMRHWETLHTDEGAHFDREVRLDAADLPPIVSWGTSPQDVASIIGAVPRVEDGATEQKRASIKRALDYMGLKGGEKIDRYRDRPRLHRLLHQRPHRGPARRRRDRQGPQGRERVNAMVVPGSGLVKAQAEAEGLDKIFLAAGFEWREPGCSMCLAMNPDKLAPGERCASTSNRNFEGRQGYKRPHAPRLARDGGGGGDRRPVRRREGAGGRGMKVGDLFIDESEIVESFVRASDRAGRTSTRWRARSSSGSTRAARRACPTTSRSGSSSSPARAPPRTA